MTELYDGVTQENWLEELEKTRLDNRKYLYALWALSGTPGSMLDVGCGSGDLVMRSRQLGITAFGVDQIDLSDKIYYDPGWYSQHDLRSPFNLRSIDGAPSTVDIVLCWEVAEHIPEKSHEILCDTCANHLHRGSYSRLIFTAAHPGQGGTEHISGRTAIYWRDMFHARGLNFLPKQTSDLSLMWKIIPGACYWLAANVQVFERG